MQCGNACGICDCVGLGLIIAGGVLVWGRSGSLASGAEAVEGEDKSIYLV